MITPIQTAPVVAYLRNVFKTTQGPMLHQADINHHGIYETFREFAADLWKWTSYSKPQSSKFETYSWSPSYYKDGWWRPKTRPDAELQYGAWRTGETASDEVSLGYFDLDNQHHDRTMITIDLVEEILREIGVSYLLYTSYSHKPERHKVRIVTPISRDMTWDEAFAVFARFNVLFDYQLDGSIYDAGDHLYGPAYGGERREWLEGQSLDVDAWIAIPLTDEDQQYTKRGDNEKKRIRREWTPEEVETYKAQIADKTVQMDASISNPAVFNPDWLALVDSKYVGGSRHQTLYGIMTKVWLKSKGSLSFGDMRSIQQDVDLRWNFYCESHYGKGTLESDLRSVMANAVLVDVQVDKELALQQAMQRLSSKLAK